MEARKLVWSLVQVMIERTQCLLQVVLLGIRWFSKIHKPYWSMTFEVFLQQHENTPLNTNMSWASNVLIALICWPSALMFLNCYKLNLSLLTTSWHQESCGEDWSWSWVSARLWCEVQLPISNILYPTTCKACNNSNRT